MSITPEEQPGPEATVGVPLHAGRLALEASRLADPSERFTAWQDAIRNTPEEPPTTCEAIRTFIAETTRLDITAPAANRKVGARIIPSETVRLLLKKLQPLFKDVDNVGTAKLVRTYLGLAFRYQERFPEVAALNRLEESFEANGQDELAEAALDVKIAYGAAIETLNKGPIVRAVNAHGSTYIP